MRDKEYRVKKKNEPQSPRGASLAMRFTFRHEVRKKAGEKEE
jgi:hypothetical protein